jgi:hypothetical protein
MKVKRTLEDLGLHEMLQTVWWTGHGGVWLDLTSAQ